MSVVEEELRLEHVNVLNLTVRRWKADRVPRLAVRECYLYARFSFLSFSLQVCANTTNSRLSSFLRISVHRSVHQRLLQPKIYGQNSEMIVNLK